MVDAMGRTATYAMVAGAIMGAAADAKTNAELEQVADVFAQGCSGYEQANARFEEILPALMAQFPEEVQVARKQAIKTTAMYKASAIECVKSEIKKSGEFKGKHIAFEGDLSWDDARGVKTVVTDAQSAKPTSNEKTVEELRGIIRNQGGNIGKAREEFWKEREKAKDDFWEKRTKAADDFWNEVGR